MYISCPKCNTNFMVLPEQIGAYGRKVKCSKCAHIWHQKLTDSVKLEPVISAQSSKQPITPTSTSFLSGGINLPALLPIKIPQYLYTLPVLLISLIIFLSLILFQDTFGVRSSASLKFISIKDVHIQELKESGKIVMSYKIVNTSNHEISIPLVRIRFLDKNHNITKYYIEDQTKIGLAPRQYVNIKTEFSSVPASTELMDLTVGNMLDFILR